MLLRNLNPACRARSRVKIPKRFCLGHRQHLRTRATAASPKLCPSNGENFLQVRTKRCRI